jgi:hypothetical protein
VRNGGKVSWTDTTQGSSSNLWLCAGYIAAETGGSFHMNLQSSDKKGWIYIADNGALHPQLRSRVFGAVGNNSTGTSNQPSVLIRGRDMTRTWSLLSTPLTVGATTMRLQDNPINMGWKVGDRIAVAPTNDRMR